MEGHTGYNGNNLEDCLSKSLSEMCGDPRYIEDLQTIANNLKKGIIGLELKICDLTTLLEHYEKINNERIRENILAHKDEIDNMY